MDDEEQFDLEQVRAVIKLAAESDIAELEVESPTLRVLVKKLPGGVVSVSHVQTQAPRHVSSPVPAAGAPGLEHGTNHLRPITAPMVGTFYRSASPDASPFVEEGDAVEPGQIVCIIEAMKLFNEIQCELKGRVVKVLAENGAPVEYGQTLFLVDPSSNGS
ncbi:MAG: acetyl-CoA carboxylase biotin carboxyl carrier protein [bacterium]